DLGIDRERVVEVYNKSDRFDEHFLPRSKGSVAVSALTGAGIDRLTDIIRGRERVGGELMNLEVPHEASRVAAQLHEVAEVYEQIVNDRGTIFRVWVPNHAVHLFQAYSADT